MESCLQWWLLDGHYYFPISILKSIVIKNLLLLLALNICWFGSGFLHILCVFALLYLYYSWMVLVFFKPLYFITYYLVFFWPKSWVKIGKSWEKLGKLEKIKWMNKWMNDQMNLWDEGMSSHNVISRRFQEEKKTVTAIQPLRALFYGCCKWQYIIVCDWAATANQCSALWHPVSWVRLKNLTQRLPSLHWQNNPHRLEKPHCRSCAHTWEKE